MQLRFSVDEHRRASGLLQRVHAGLQGVFQMIGRKSFKTHPIQASCAKSLAAVRSLQLELENTARRDHPQDNIIYLTGNERTSPGVLADAIAGHGENIGEVD